MPITVLVVDPDTKALRLISEMLRERYKELGDVNVVGIQDGEDAIEYLTEHGDYVDTILLGTDMPLTDGWEVLQIIKDEDNWPSLPVVMMVPQETVWDDALKAHTLGADHFISSPVSSFELTSVLDGLLVGESA